jgi:hypothetical protein
MGTGDRKKSGNLFTGSRLVVDGQGNSGVLRNKSNGFNNIFKTANTGPGPSLNPASTQEPTISVYSQVLDFFSTPQYNSIKYRCDGTQVQACFSPGGYNNITDVVALFNSPPPIPLPGGCNDPSFCYCWTDYGTYYDNGDGRIRCEMLISVYNTLCSGGILTLDVIND